jgi:hypothetical protein
MKAMNKFTVDDITALLYKLNYDEVYHYYNEDRNGEHYFEFEAYTDDVVIVGVTVKKDGTVVVYDQYYVDKHGCNVAKAKLDKGEWTYEYI